MQPGLGRRAHLWPHESDVEIFHFSEGILLKGIFGFLLPVTCGLFAAGLVFYAGHKLGATLLCAILFLFDGEPIRSLVAWWLEPHFTQTKLHVSIQRRLMTFAEPIVKETFSFDELRVKHFRCLLLLRGFEIIAVEDGACLARTHFLWLSPNAARIVAMLER